MSSHDRTENEIYTQKIVGFALIGVACFSLFHSVIWFFMRAQNSPLSSSFVGAEGMAISSIVFVVIGAYLVRKSFKAASAK